ncbi:MAG: hypothetical protein RL088_2565 [Verrucomicrobiota bacterium]
MERHVLRVPQRGWAVGAVGGGFTEVLRTLAVDGDLERSCVEAVRCVTAAMANDEQPALKQTLGFWQIAFYGLGSMLGAGIYALIGRASESLGNAVWLAFIVAMVAALLTGLSYASVGSRYPRAGGAAYVTHRAFDRAWLSYVVGIAVMMSGLTSMATGSQAIAENLQRALGLSLDTKWLAIAFVALIGAVIYRGIRESMWANIVCTVVEAS